MTSKKTTRRALFSSIMALILCCAMLVGSTFAWFTDSVTSTNNIIKSGNLDVELEYLVDGTWEKVTSTTNVFEENTLWEPGHTEVVYLKVSNVGSLALKYALEVNVASETAGTNVAGDTFKLSDYIYYGAIESETEKVYASRDEAREVAEADATKLNVSYANVDNLLETDEADYVALVVYMPETVGNEANYLTGTTAPVINLGINLFATQEAYEEDSFGDDYDGEAFVPVAKVTELELDSVKATMGMGGTASELELDVAYAFEPTESYEDAQKGAYGKWHADFVVYADKDVPADSIALAGYYSAFCDDFNGGNWVALTAGETITAGTEVRLVQAMGNGGITVNYEEICNYGNDGIGFRCGAADMTGVNNGTTLTVELRLYEVEEPSESDGNSWNVETGKYITVGKYTHTFTADPVVVSGSEELAAAIGNGETNLYLEPGTYTIPDAAKGKTLTISGTKGAVIVVQDESGAAYANPSDGTGVDYGFDGSTVTFNGVTIDTTGQTGTYRSFARMTGIYNDCAIIGTYTLGTGTSEFNNCTFDTKNNYVWTWGASEVAFNNCVFNCTEGKAILVYGGTSAIVTVNNCTFNASVAAYTWDKQYVSAVEIDNSMGSTYTVEFQGTNIVNFTGTEADADGNSGFNGLWRLKTAAVSDRITVIGG